jgi:hypothetical protein
MKIHKVDNHILKLNNIILRLFEIIDEKELNEKEKEKYRAIKDYYYSHEE